VSAPRLLCKPANITTLKVIKGELRGQYHIVLGRSEQITQFFAGLPEIVDRSGLRIDI
jgi:hypothetical protein